MHSEDHESALVSVPGLSFPGLPRIETARGNEQEVTETTEVCSPFPLLPPVQLMGFHKPSRQRKVSEGALTDYAKTGVTCADAGQSDASG